MIGYACTMSSQKDTLSVQDNTKGAVIPTNTIINGQPNTEKHIPEIPTREN